MWIPLWAIVLVILIVAELIGLAAEGSEGESKPYTEDESKPYIDDV